MTDLTLTGGKLMDNKINNYLDKFAKDNNIDIRRGLDKSSYSKFPMIEEYYNTKTIADCYDIRLSEIPVVDNVIVLDSYRETKR